MERPTKIYIFGVIEAGGLVLAYALSHLSAAEPWSWAIYTALTVLASVVKLRLPGMDGTYSLSSLLLLYGVAHFSLGETLVAGCLGVMAQGLLNTKARANLIQVLFNVANVAISAGACFMIGRVWLAGGMARHLPAVMAAVACVYFVINTVLVSGVLSLLQGCALQSAMDWLLVPSRNLKK